MLKDNINRRRALIIGAGLAAAAPSLIRADSSCLVEMPGDPLTRRGLQAAAKWATEDWREVPGVRLTFADGSSYRWHYFPSMRRGQGSAKAFAVAIDVVTTDAAGRRFITSVPVDGVDVERRKHARTLPSGFYG